MTKNIGGQLLALPPNFFPKMHPIKNSDIAILFSIVKNPVIYVFEDNIAPPPEPLGNSFSVRKLAHCLRTVFLIGSIRKFSAGIFSTGIIFRRGEAPRGLKFSREIL